MKISAIFVVVLGVFLSGCTSFSYTPLSAKKYPPTVAEKVEMFLTTFPDKAFIVIGTVEVTGSQRPGGPGVFAKIRERAAAVGADAIIIKPGGTTITGVFQLDSEFGDQTILPTRKYVLTAVVIRWKGNS